MTIQDGFKRIFDNAFFIMDSEILDCENYTQLNSLGNDFDHNFIHELINWFAKNYNTDILGMYSDYLKKCNNSFIDKIKQLVSEDK